MDGAPALDDLDLGASVAPLTSQSLEAERGAGVLSPLIDPLMTIEQNRVNSSKFAPQTGLPAILGGPGVDASLPRVTPAISGRF